MNYPALMSCKKLYCNAHFIRIRKSFDNHLLNIALSIEIIKKRKIKIMNNYSTGPKFIMLQKKVRK